MKFLSNTFWIMLGFMIIAFFCFLLAHLLIPEVEYRFPKLYYGDSVKVVCGIHKGGHGKVKEFWRSSGYTIQFEDRDIATIASRCLEKIP